MLSTSDVAVSTPSWRRTSFGGEEMHDVRRCCPSSRSEQRRTRGCQTALSGLATSTHNHGCSRSAADIGQSEESRYAPKILTRFSAASQNAAVSTPASVIGTSTKSYLVSADSFCFTLRTARSVLTVPSGTSGEQVLVEAYLGDGLEELGLRHDDCAVKGMYR